MLNNALNNNIVIKALGREFFFNYLKHQICYIPYYLNLIIKSIIYNSKKDNITQLLNTQGDADFEDKDKEIYVNIIIDKISIGSDSLDIKVNKSKDKDVISYLRLVVITTKELGKYYKYRPLRKLYNISIAIYQSS